MDDINIKTLHPSIDFNEDRSIAFPVGNKYIFINIFNKAVTALRVLGQAVYLLCVESFLHLKSLILSPFGFTAKRTLAQSIFRLGLSVTGEKLRTRFNFKIKHCRERQLLLLKDILNENKNSVFGKDHKFSEIHTIEDFRKNIPVCTYDSLEDYVTRQTKGETNVLVKDNPITYATTSGTSGTPKYIPITKRAQLESHQNISRIFAHSIYKEFPKAFDGTILTIVSPAEEGKTPDGTVFGSTSGQLIVSMSQVIKDKYTIPYEVLTLENYEARNYCIILLGIQNPVTMLSTANPSTLSLLAKQGNQWQEQLLIDIQRGQLDPSLDIPTDIRILVEDKIKANPALVDQLRLAIKQDPEKKLRPKHYWKSLNLITCWTGGNSNVFLERMKEWYGDVQIRDLGYLASEIRGSIPLKNSDSSGVLTIGENFFEFVKISDIDDSKPYFYLADELEVGERYYIFFTTKAGLYRYNINDIVEVTGFTDSTPNIIFVQKGKGVTNITGEKLYEQQLLAAVSHAEKVCDMKTSFYVCQANAKQARYDLYVDFATAYLSKSDIQNFVTQVEDNLTTNNLEYATKRKSKRLNPMIVFVLGEDSLEKFKNWRVSNGIREAQFKITPLVTDDSFLTPLIVNDKIEQEVAA
jgi:hypothetical protein